MNDGIGRKEGKQGKTEKENQVRKAMMEWSGRQEIK